MVLAAATGRRTTLHEPKEPMRKLALPSSPPPRRPAAPLAAQAQSTLDKVKSSGAITVAYRESSIPFSYLDDKAQPTGFGWEICGRIVDEVKKATGRADLKVNTQAVTSANRIPLLMNGTIDIECGSTTNNSERAKQVAFATNYFYTGTRFLVKAGTPIEGAGRPEGQAGWSRPRAPPTSKIIRNLNEETEARHRPARREGPRRVRAAGAKRPRRRLRDGRHPALRPEGEFRQSRPSSRWWVIIQVEPTRSCWQDDPAFKKLVDDTLVGLMKSGEFEALQQVVCIADPAWDQPAGADGKPET